MVQLTEGVSVSGISLLSRPLVALVILLLGTAPTLAQEDDPLAPDISEDGWVQPLDLEELEGRKKDKGDWLTPREIEWNELEVGARYTHWFAFSELDVGHYLDVPERSHRRSQAEFDMRNIQLYDFWIGAGIAYMRISHREVVFRDSARLVPPGGFQFGSVEFQPGDLMDTKIKLETANMEVVIRALFSRYFHMEIMVGIQWNRWRVEAINHNPLARESDKLWLVNSMYGLALVGRPFRGFEVYVQGKGSVSSWTTFEGNDSDGFDLDENTWFSALGTLEVGVRYRLPFGLGITAGYHADLYDVERTEGGGTLNTGRAPAVIPERIKFLHGRVHGPFVGVYASF